MDIAHISNSNTRADHLSASIAVSTGTAKARETSPAIMSNAVQKTEAVAEKAVVDDALQSINKHMQTQSPNLEFSVDEDSNRTIVKVMDRSTGEVIRQMPSAEAIEIARALDKLQGLLVSDKA